MRPTAYGWRLAWNAVPAVCLALLLSGCGDSLGDYQVVGAQLVREMPADPDRGSDPPYPEYVAIELSSETDLSKKETGAGLYTDADFCSLRRRRDIIAFGPTDLQGQPVEGYRRSTGLQRHPSDGRFHYVVYVVPEAPARPTFDQQPASPGYDLRRAGRDLCLRFSVPGYFSPPSRSNRISVPAALLAGALDSRG